ncbi:GerMN domain-containing protein [Acidobacteriota bacterium]
MIEKNRLIITGALLFLFVILMIVFLTLGVKDSTSSGPSVLVTDPDSGEVLEAKTRSVILYFISEEDSLLHPETRKILDLPSVSLMGRNLVEELLLGSRNGLISPFPQDTKLREFYLTEEGVAYADFSREIRESHMNGASADVAIVYSIVNSLTENFSEIKKVFILIDGRESQTLGGHVDLTRPFIPRKDLIKK